MSKKIIYKTPQQIQNITISGKYLTELLSKLQDQVKPGVSLFDLEHFAQKFLDKNNIKGAFKGYMGFPANLCTSINDCIVHGIPDNTILKDGDLLKIDAGVDYKGGISDAAISIVVGGNYTNPQAANLIQATKDGLDKSLPKLGPGQTIYEFSKSIYEYVKSKGFSIVENLTGHGVGVQVHEGPHIYNRPHPDCKKIKLEPNMVVAIEPITAEKSTQVVYRKNNWNLYAQHGDLGAQREYTIVITENGYEIVAGIV